MIAVKKGWPTEKQLNTHSTVFLYPLNVISEGLYFNVFIHTEVFNIKLSSLSYSKYFYKIFSHCNLSVLFVIVQSLSQVQLFATPWTAALGHSHPSLSPEFVHIHLHWVGDTIQPSHPLFPPYPVLNLSQHQGLFQESILHIRWPKVLELQNQSFQWIFRIDFL